MVSATSHADLINLICQVLTKVLTPPKLDALMMKEINGACITAPRSLLNPHRLRTASEVKRYTYIPIVYMLCNLYAIAIS
jgi:hypothetical protein